MWIKLTDFKKLFIQAQLYLLVGAMSHEAPRLLRPHFDSHGWAIHDAFLNVSEYDPYFGYLDHINVLYLR